MPSSIITAMVTTDSTAASNQPMIKTPQYSLRVARREKFRYRRIKEFYLRWLRLFLREHDPVVLCRILLCVPGVWLFSKYWV